MMSHCNSTLCKLVIIATNRRNCILAAKYNSLHRTPLAIFSPRRFSLFSFFFFYSFFELTIMLDNGDFSFHTITYSYVYTAHRFTFVFTPAIPGQFNPQYKLTCLRSPRISLFQCTRKRHGDRVVTDNRYSTYSTPNLAK